MGMRPWIAVAYSAPAAALTSVLLVYPIGQGSFSEGMALGIAGTFHFMMAVQADHNILMHPASWLGVFGVLGGALLSSLHGSLVTSSLIRETIEQDSPNAGYHFGQQQVTYHFAAGHYGYLGRLMWRGFGSNNSRAVHFLLVALPTLGIWGAAIGVGLLSFNLNGLNFNQALLDSQGHPIATYADLINRADLGMQVMHAPNAHHFPLLLAGNTEIPIATELLR